MSRSDKMDRGKRKRESKDRIKRRKKSKKLRESKKLEKLEKPQKQKKTKKISKKYKIKAKITAGYKKFKKSKPKVAPSTCFIINLPPEVAIHILEDIPYSELIRLRIICSYWKMIIHDMLGHIKVLYISSNYITKMLSLCQRIETLFIMGTVYICKLPRAIESCKTLTQITIYGTLVGLDASHLCDKIPDKLHEITVSSRFGIPSLDNLTQLHTLHIEDAKYSSIKNLTLPINLQNLSISLRKDHGGQCLLGFLKSLDREENQNAPQLKSFTIKNKVSTCSKCLPYYGSLHSIETLSLHNCDDMEEEFLEEIAKLRSLREISVSKFGLKNLKNSQELFVKNPNIQRFSTDADIEMTDSLKRICTERNIVLDIVPK
jgi:hypothetical protein